MPPQEDGDGYFSIDSLDALLPEGEGREEEPNDAEDEDVFVAVDIDANELSSTDGEIT